MHHSRSDRVSRKQSYCWILLSFFGFKFASTFFWSRGSGRLARLVLLHFGAVQLELQLATACVRDILLQRYCKDIHSAAVRAHTASWLEDESNTTRGSTRGTTQATVDRTHDKLQTHHVTRPVFDSSCPGPRAPPHLPTSSQPHRLHGPWPAPRPLTHMIVLNLRSTSSASAPMPQLLLSPLTSHNLQATHGA